MKFQLALAAALSLAALAAQAQTGRPADAPTASSEAVSVGGSAPGSYARYLMLNGTPRDVAIAQARNIDHPAAAKTPRNGVATGGAAGQAAAQR